MDAIAVPAARVRSWLHCPARAEPRNISWLGKGAAAAASSGLLMMHQDLPDAWLEVCLAIAGRR
eukprot:COSAG06_NODE_63384_length_262_cov_0.938650_1_plen_63_part_01